MAALSKADLANQLDRELGLNTREAKGVVDLFFERISAALERGEEVRLSGFGNFNLRDKVARPGRNPKTGETHEVAARRVVTFYPGQKLREIVAHEMAEQDD